MNNNSNTPIQQNPSSVYPQNNTPKNNKKILLFSILTLAIIISILIVSIFFFFRNKKQPAKIKKTPSSKSQTFPTPVNYTPITVTYQSKELLYAEIKNQIIKIFKSQ